MIRTLMLTAILAAPLVAADFTFEAAGEPPAEGVPAAVIEMLAGEGVRVKGPDGKVVAEYWPRAKEFAGEGTSAFGVRYDNIPDGALLGIVQFPAEFSDFREQNVPSGVYTLRFALHPEDGNHMGVAASRDFAVLIPAEHDTEPAKNPTFDELVEMTKKVGNPHPTIARLELPDSDGGPHLWENYDGHWVLDLPVAGDAVGIVVYGHSAE